MTQLFPPNVWDIYDMNAGKILNRRPYVLLWSLVDDVMYIKCYYNLHKKTDNIVRLDLAKMGVI
ncbi:MAG TPA: hypothetical protein PKI14_01320 [Fervidobacterium sp.]|nr:hypothetical protein [Fervidobacterium sp.]